MRVSKLKTGAIRLLQLECTTPPEGFYKGDEVHLQYNEATSAVVVARGERAVLAVGATPAHRQNLLDLVEAGAPFLCWVVGVKEHTLTVQAHVFAMHYRYDEPQQLLVSEGTVEAFNELHKDNPPMDTKKVMEKLTDALFIPPVLQGGHVRMLLYGRQRQNLEEWPTFSILGQPYSVEVVRNRGEMHVHRVWRTSERKAHQGTPVTVLEAPWSCKDITLNAITIQELQANATAPMQTETYMYVWREYQRLQMEFAVQKARELGIFEFRKSPSTTSQSWEFQIPDLTEEQAEQLNRQGEVLLEVCDRLPVDLDPSAEPGRRVCHLVPLIAADSQHGTIQVGLPEREVIPLGRGFLHLSLSGSRTQTDRQERAIKRIEDGEAAMPHLGMILSEQHIPTRHYRKKRVRTAHSRWVQEVFKGEPTSKQEQAIDIAINTPDIALIQGPPGTGKTRVIAAVQARLGELYAEVDHYSSRILLTSTQHVAVENAAAATRVYGMPSVKLDARSKSGDREVPLSIEQWRHQRMVELRSELSKHPEHPLSHLHREAQELVIKLVTLRRSSEDPVHVLGRLLEVVSPLFAGHTLVQQLRDMHMRWKIHTSGGEETQGTLRAIRGLSTEVAAFLDDGPIRARKVLRLLEGELTPQEQHLLQQASTWYEETPPDFLPELAALKERLLTEHTVRGTGPAGEVITEADREVLTQTIHHFTQHLRNAPENKVTTILYDYLDVLENQPRQVQDVIQAYTAVIAATCQHSDSRAVAAFKEKTDRNQAQDFDTVIVDEASRVNPLDLMIPMSKARRRIVLVGDHRQLPHFLEPDVAGQVRKSVSQEYAEALDKSLFERLYFHLKQLEATDNIQRVVTLDRQYRMHPLLGEFVSDQFYAPYGEGFSSGLPSEHFKHTIGRFRGQPAAWLNVPHLLEPEKGQRSKYRTVEARVIAREVKQILDQHPDLTVGVISFYARQVREIEQALLGVEVYETDQGMPCIRPEYRHTTGDLRERLKVGTVDAFQGMEFDVVFLSFTRSNTLPANTALDERRKFGHLTLENRQCVALSRQQRLLVVVGDAQMVHQLPEHSSVQALSRYYELCKGPHGCIVSA